MVIRCSFLCFARSSTHPFSARWNLMRTHFDLPHSVRRTIPIFMIDWHVRNHLLIRWPWNVFPPDRNQVYFVLIPRSRRSYSTTGQNRTLRRGHSKISALLEMRLVMAFHLLFKNANETALASRNAYRSNLCVFRRSIRSITKQQFWITNWLNAVIWWTGRCASAHKPLAARTDCWTDFSFDFLIAFGLCACLWMWSDFWICLWYSSSVAIYMHRDCLRRLYTGWEWKILV